MTDISAARDLLVDSFTRIRDELVELTDGLSDETAWYRPDDRANSIAWLLWHLTRIQDDHVAGLAGTEQAWPWWRERFELPFGDDATGYGMTAADVGQVRVGADLLAGYHADVHEATARYLQQLSADELTRVVDRSWDPPVTASVRLVSVIGDALQHLGQAAYVRGMAERRAEAWARPTAADR